MLSLTDLFAQTLNFIILTAVLTRVLYRPVLTVLEQRKDDIEARDRQATAFLDEARQKAEAASRRLDQTSERSREILDQTEKRALQVEEQVIERARLRAQDIVKDAEQEVNRAVQQATDRVLSEAVDTVFRVSSALLAREIRKEDHQRLVDGLIETVAGGGDPDR